MHGIRGHPFHRAGHQAEAGSEGRAELGHHFRRQPTTMKLRISSFMPRGLRARPQAPIKQVERPLRGPLLDRQPVPAQPLLLHHRAFRIGQAQIDEADRLRLRSSGGAGNAGDGKANIALAGLADPFRHRGRRLPAYGAVRREGRLRHSQEPHLRLIGVSDQRGEEIIGTTGDVGQTVPDQAPGAGFGRGQRQAGRAQHVPDQHLEGLVAGAVDVHTQTLANLRPPPGR